MRSYDFFKAVESDPLLPDANAGVDQLDEALLEQLRRGPLDNVSDVSAAIALLDLVESELLEYATTKDHVLTNHQSRLAIRTLVAVTKRVGAPIQLNFADFPSFRSYWERQGADTWKARRSIVFELLGEPRRRLNEIEDSLPSSVIAEELVANLRDPTAIREHLARLQRALTDDPPLAIGTAKELVESTAKTVLFERGQTVNDKDDLPKLVAQAQLALGLHPRSGGVGPDATNAVRQIMSGLTQIVTGLGELRNRGYGTGHGPKGERTGLHRRHAQLAVNASMTWCSIMLDTLADPRAPWRAHAEVVKEAPKSGPVLE